MRELIFTITLNISYLFFAINSILGNEYKGVNESSSYILSITGFTALSLIFILGENILKKAAPLRKINFLFYLIPLFFCFIYLIEFQNNTTTYNYFILYLAFSFPATYIGTYVAANKSLKAMAKWWDLVSIIITLGLIISFPKIVFIKEVTLGGASYQTISYMAAFAYNINLFSLLFRDKYPRFKFLQSKIFNVISYLFLFFQVICIFISGGRGGFVVVFIGSVILLYKKSKGYIMWGKVILITITIFLTFILLPKILPLEVRNTIQIGSGRLFSYISSEGIDMTETSGRDIVYSTVLKSIIEQPIIGHGIFNVNANEHGAHNIFLEFLLQGGLLYFLFWIIIFVLLYHKYKRIIKVDNINLLLIPITLYPFIELLFSGSYMTTSLFWFVIAYIFNFKIKKEEPLYIGNAKMINAA